jgi:hypothetical protein
MMDITYTITNAIRDHLRTYIDDITDLAAQGNAPDVPEIVDDIEQIIAGWVYLAAKRDVNGALIDEMGPDTYYNGDHDDCGINTPHRHA